MRASIGKRSTEYSTRSPFFLGAMGSTCKQGKPNGNQKREGTTLTLGRRRSKKRRLNLLKAIGSEGCLPSSYRKGQPILLIIRKGVRLASKPTRPRGIKRSLSVLTWISCDEKRRPKVTSSRGRSLALGDRLAVCLGTAKRLPGAKDSFLSPDARTSKAFSYGGLRVEHLQTIAT